MPTFAGFLHTAAGAADDGKTINLLARNTTTPALATTTTDSNGFWQIVHGTEGLFDLEVVIDSNNKFRIKYDDSFQVELGEFGQLFLRGTDDAFTLEFQSTPTASRIVTFPDATDTAVLLAETQTLTNKTLTTPTITTPDIDGGTIDNAVIGGSTPAAATVTILTTTGNAVIAAGASLLFGAISVLVDSPAGTMTLSNIDAIDATTETTLEAAIDSLANLTVVGTVVTGTWEADVVDVTRGGTGLADPTDHLLLVGSGASDMSTVAIGTSGQVLTSQGAGADPTFTNITSGSVATGTYTGDGTTDQGITGVGFLPKVLWVWRRQTAASAAPIPFWTTTEQVDNSANGLATRQTTDAVTFEHAIISLDADGFSVDDNGADDPPNINGVTYEFWAIG